MKFERSRATVSRGRRILAISIGAFYRRLTVRQVRVRQPLVSDLGVDETSMGQRSIGLYLNWDLKETWAFRTKIIFAIY
ncbi:hypothetical protein RJ639_028251 [Escallonia herrerae]|uniref:Uncharacterized protein n=1 Tax=Escallonia herrerae TaxID=1293975 RepID=A0AA88X4N8_9ASTE|nr:hypothetical protein RJ639_028251 [Escallonia herrerae]